jgi:hypothetical protein
LSSATSTFPAEIWSVMIKPLMQRQWLYPSIVRQKR